MATNKLNFTSSRTPAVIWTREEYTHETRTRTNRSMNIIDLFCGCGGLSYGIKRALLSLGIKASFCQAYDLSKSALGIYNRNIKPINCSVMDASNLLRVTRTSPVAGLTIPDLSCAQLDISLLQHIGQTDIFIAGPPCEGNSNLNNITRRSDPRNELYVTAVSIGIMLDSKIIIIENVPTVRNANQQVVERSIQLLGTAGYKVFNSNDLLAAHRFLVAQTRKRHFLIAVRADCCQIDAVDEANLGIMFDPLSLMDVIGDIVNNWKGSQQSEMDRLGNISADNMKRIDHLFNHDIYNLPNKLRPPCHRDKKHNYNSVFGRMYGNKPAPTLSTGFLSPGRGRYIHPTQRRCLTLREGARIQGFPDYYDWFVGPESTRTSVARHIGDAVPPNLGMAACLIAMSKLKREN